MQLREEGARRPFAIQPLRLLTRAILPASPSLPSPSLPALSRQTGWCYRRKENFTFRYDALEDELRVANLTPQQTVAMAMAQAAGLQG